MCVCVIVWLGDKGRIAEDSFDVCVFLHPTVIEITVSCILSTVFSCDCSMCASECANGEGSGHFRCLSFFPIAYSIMKAFRFGWRRPTTGNSTTGQRAIHSTVFVSSLRLGSTRTCTSFSNRLAGPLTKT